ncbi:MAG: chemotaxis response regulator protein-glutamate methylesterase [Bryobacteraceae bacterium]
MSTRVLVVDDSAVFRRVVSEALTGLPDVEVVGTASNGRLALSRLDSIRPDLLTVDIEMPEMNGIELLQAITDAGSTAGTIVLSSLTRRGGELTMRALELGAFDFLTKPETTNPAAGIAELRTRLAPMLRAFQRKREIRSLLAPGAKRVAGPIETKNAGPVTLRSVTRSGSPLVLIGVSTGGPAALAELLPAIPANFGAPVLIVQHMPPLFTQALASSLQRKCALRVKEAENDEIVLAGGVYLAPGGKQMKIATGPKGEIAVKLTDDPPENNCRPAVDYLFRSAALSFPGRSIAVILTGMGQDGTQGLKLLKRSGCFSVAQDEATSVVFGMPRAAVEAGLVDSVLPLNAIAHCLLRQVSGTRL